MKTTRELAVAAQRGYWKVEEAQLKTLTVFVTSLRLYLGSSQRYIAAALENTYREISKEVREMDSN
jgi:hypothetical protein